jgi:hypothetical protein
MSAPIEASDFSPVGEGPARGVAADPVGSRTPCEVRQVSRPPTAPVGSASGRAERPWIQALAAEESILDQLEVGIERVVRPSPRATRRGYGREQRSRTGRGSRRRAYHPSWGSRSLRGTSRSNGRTIDSPGRRRSDARASRSPSAPPWLRPVRRRNGGLTGRRGAFRIAGHTTGADDCGEPQRESRNDGRAHSAGVRLDPNPQAECHASMCSACVGR